MYFNVCVLSAQKYNNSFDETGPDAQLIVSTFQETWIMQLFILFTHICPHGDLHDQLTDEQLLSVVF